MMGDKQWSREAEINNSLQLLNWYPAGFAAHNLIPTILGENKNLQNFAKRIEIKFQETLIKLSNPK